jgi:hypothetical protein
MDMQGCGNGLRQLVAVVAPTCVDDDATAVATAASLGVTVTDCAHLVATAAACDDATYGEAIRSVCPVTCAQCAGLLADLDLDDPSMTLADVCALSCGTCEPPLPPPPRRHVNVSCKTFAQVVGRLPVFASHNVYAF